MTNPLNTTTLLSSGETYANQDQLPNMLLLEENNLPLYDDGAKPGSNPAAQPGHNPTIGVGMNLRDEGSPAEHQLPVSRCRTPIHGPHGLPARSQTHGCSMQISFDVK